MTVCKGPAQIEWNSLKLQTQGEVVVTLNPESFDVLTDAWGTVDTRLKSRAYTVVFTPSGQHTGEAMTMIVAAANRVAGTSVMEGSLVIRPHIAGQPVITIDRAGVTGLPGLRLGATKTLFGAITFTGLETDGDTTGALLASASHVAPTHTFDPANILTEPWSGTWATVPAPETPDGSMLVGLETEDGWEITTELTTEPSMVDSVGIADFTQADFKVTATCKPVNITEAAILEVLQRTTAGRSIKPGDSFHGRASDGALQPRNLYLTSRSGYLITITNAGVRAGILNWGAKVNRTGTLTFVGLRKFSAGAMQPMLTFAVPSEPGP